MPDPHLLTRFHAAARLLGLTAALVGTVAMTGWVLSVDVLKSVVPGLVTMKANTALCFILLGGALSVLAQHRPKPALARLAKAAALLAGGLALLIFSQFVFGWDSGVDLLLFHEAPGQVGTVHPGRMALNTSVAFVLVAACLLSLGHARLVQPLSLLVLCLSGGALAGYMSGVTTLYGAAGQTQMAVPTASGFLLLSLGLICARVERGPAGRLVASGPGGSLLRRLLPTVVLLPLLLGLARLEGEAAGLYDRYVGVWLMVLGTVGLTTVVVWLLARSVQGADEARGQAAAQLEASESQYRSLAQNAIEAIVSADAEGIIAYANPATEATFGWTTDELCGQPLTVLIPEHLHAAHEQGMRRFIEGGEAKVIGRTVELEGLTREGQEFPLELSLSSWTGPEGLFFTGIMRDVTPQRRASQRAATRHEATRALAGSPSLDEALPRVLTGVCEGLGWAVGAVWMLDEDSQELRLREVASPSPEMARDFRARNAGLSFAAGVGIPGTVWEGGEAAWLEDARQAGVFNRTGMARELGLRGVICVPILSEDCKPGVVEFFSSHTERPDADLLGVIGTVGKELGQFVRLRQREQDLRTAEERFRLAFEHAGIGMALVGLDGRWLQVNEETCRITGRSEETLTQLTFRDVTHPDDLEADEGYAAQLLAGEIQSYSMEKRYLRPSGEVVWVRLTGSLIRDESDAPLHFIAQIEDVTDRKQAKVELQRSARHFEMASDLLCTANFEGTFTQLNSSWQQVLGWSDDELRAEPFVNFVHPEDLEATVAESAKLLGGGRTVSFSNRYSTKSGGWRWLEWTAIGVPEDGLIYASARDVTDQHRANKKFRGLLESAPDAIVIVDDEESIVLVNAQTERLFGYDRAELLGRQTSELIPDWRRAHAEGDLVALRKDGSEVPVEVSVSPLETEEGTLVSAAIRDVSERRRAAEELAVARDQALAESRHKSEFLANMSHEIRTPMNGVIGMTELLLDSELSGEQREHAELVRTSGEMLVALVNDILDFSKIEAGKLELDTSTFELVRAAEDVAELMSERARAKGLELSVLVDHQAPGIVRGDEVRLRQVLMNLVSNAVKFTERGEVRLRVSPADGHADRCLLRFEVSDTGIGIEPGQIERLFESFTQADSSTSRQYGGTGLGLAISSRLVELMGGRLTASSQLGRGSSFSFQLPLEVCASAAAAEPSPLGGRRVLVVDDNSTNRHILCHHGQAWGMRVDSVDSGKGALRLLGAAAEEGAPVHTALVDMDMPGMSGTELTRAIRKDARLRETLVVLLSSSLDREAAREAGVDRVLAKPVRQERLKRMLLEGAQPTAAGTREARRARVSGAHRRVLVAEDNEVNSRLTVRLLERRGFRADVAPDGRAAVEAMERNAYAAVFMDCQMPGMDGYEATRAIRRLEGPDQHVPIVAMTANSGAVERERCLAAGMDDYLEKPLDTEAFDTTLRYWFDGPLDEEAIERLEGDLGGADALEELLGMYLEQAPEQVATVAAALANGDASGLCQAAHALKGSSASIGARAVGDAARALEEAARGGALEGAESLLDDLEQAFGETQLALSERANRLPA